MRKFGRIIVVAACLACPANASLGAQTNARETVSWMQTSGIEMTPVSNQIQYVRILLEISSIQGALLRMGNHALDYLQSCRKEPAQCNTDAAMFYSQAQSESDNILTVIGVWGSQADDRLLKGPIEEADISDIGQKLAAAEDALSQVKHDYDRGASTERQDALDERLSRHVINVLH